MYSQEKFWRLDSTFAGLSTYKNNPGLILETKTEKLLACLPILVQEETRKPMDWQEIFNTEIDLFFF